MTLFEKVQYTFHAGTRRIGMRAIGTTRWGEAPGPLIDRLLRRNGMKVFISSVTHLLKEERAALPPFLRLF
ncbi:hypothetical protein, partial [Mycobacterium sp.]|uniref:hypothetical protein n=1 Tax=Mycobacterium sp. TaxID=1785 RepID=UPI003C768510